MIALASAALKIPQRRIVLNVLQTALPSDGGLVRECAQHRPIRADDFAFGYGVPAGSVGNHELVARIDAGPQIEMQVNTLQREGIAHQINRRLFWQVRMDEGTGEL